MDGIGEDLFFLSNTPVFYSVLARSGYFPVAELATFRLINTRLGSSYNTRSYQELESHQVHLDKDCQLVLELLKQKTK
jgi:transketolase N-terminal domain/subunit